jgi:hypothetical protein
MRAKPITDSDEATRQNDLIESDDPRWRKSSSAIDAPHRRMLRKESDDPKLVKHITDSEKTEPTRAKPKRDTAEPSLVILRKATEEPSDKKSRIEIDAPSIV